MVSPHARIALLIAVLPLVLAARSAGAALPTVTLGPPVLVAHPLQGQFPDSAFALVPDGNETMLFWTDGSLYRTRGPTLFTQPAQANPPGDILTHGPAGSYDVNGDWLLAVFRIDSQNLVGFTHTENHAFKDAGPPAEWNYSATVTSDDDGASWTKRGLIIEDQMPDAPRFGGSSMASVVYDSANRRYMGWAANFAYISEDPLGASGTWKRWYNGSFSQPGLLGMQSGLPTLDSNAAGPWVHWNTCLNRWLGFYEKNGDSHDVWMTASDDGITWDPPAQIIQAASSYGMAYVQMMSDTDSRFAGQDAYLVFAAAPATQPGAARDMVTRTIHLSGVTCAPALDGGAADGGNTDGGGPGDGAPGDDGSADATTASASDGGGTAADATAGNTDDAAGGVLDGGADAGRIAEPSKSAGCGCVVSGRGSYPLWPSGILCGLGGLAWIRRGRRHRARTDGRFVRPHQPGGQPKRGLTGPEPR